VMVIRSFRVGSLERVSVPFSMGTVLHQQNRLSNRFTSAFKELEPIPQFNATAKLSGFLEQQCSRKF